MTNPYTPPGSDGQVPDFRGGTPGERPTAITVICVLMGIGLVVALPAILLVGSKLPGWYTGLVAVSSLVGLACLIGLWNMKRWAVYLYTGMTAVGQVALLAGGLWSPSSIIVPAIVIGVMFANLSRMS